MIKNNKIWFCSDKHHGHSNVLSLCSRHFPNITEHDDYLIQNHNQYVSDNDTVYDLGDFAFRCSSFYAVNRLKDVNGHIKIILGNHDKPLRQAYRKGLLKDMLKSGKIEIIGGENAIDQHISISTMIDINGQKIFLSHYALRTWPNAFRGSWMLYGHSHSNLPMFYKSMDIGVDTETPTHKRFTPWEFSEIKTIMDAVNKDFSEK